MAEVLSQQEIDLLLSNVKSGGEVETEIRKDKEAVPFDFRLPNRISKNQLRTIKNIHENVAESFSSYLVTKLQSVVSVNVTTVDQIYYSEYVLSVSNPACLFTFAIKNSDIKGILEFSPDLALTLVDRLLGGSGEGAKQSKVITLIEQKVLQSVVEKTMQDMKKGWQTIDNYDFIIERFEPDIDFAQITSPSESVLLISFEIVIGDQSFMMNICFATFAFDSILSKLSSKKVSSVRPTKYNGVTAFEILSGSLKSTFIPVVAEFGSSTLSMQELMELKEGDIINLNMKIDSDHVVRVANKHLFSGRVGVVNKKKAIKITKKLFPNENNF